MQFAGRIRAKILAIATLSLLAAFLSTLPPTTSVRQVQAAPAPQTTIGYGIIANESRYNLVKAMGFNWIKINLSWKSVEGTKGIIGSWSSYDAAVDTARSNGFSILMRVDDSPQWASGSTASNAPPIDDNDLANFMYLVAQHFKGKVQAYEIWNEPNLSIEWGNQPPDPIKFGRMLKALYPRVKQADPSAIVVTGGVSTTGDVSSPGAYSDIEYIARLYDPNMDRNPSDGFKGYFDAIGSHPYGGPYPPEQDPWSPPNMGTYFRRAWQHHQMAQEWGLEDVQIWATEFGWLLDPAVDGLSCDFGSHFNQMKVSEQQQADYLVRAFQYAKANWPWMGPMFIMSLDTNMDPFRQQCDEIRFFAILRPDGSPRQAYTSLKNNLNLTPVFSLSATQATFVLAPTDGDIVTQQISLGNDGGGSITSLTATSSDPSWLTTSLSSTQTPATLTITVNKAGLSLGWHTGTVTINSSAGARTITVQLFVGNVQRVYLPSAMR